MRFVSSPGENVHVPNPRFFIDVFRNMFSRTTASYVDLRFTVLHTVFYELIEGAVVQV